MRNSSIAVIKYYGAMKRTLEHEASPCGSWQCLLNTVMSPGPQASLGEHWAVENSLLGLTGQTTWLGVGRRERLLTSFVLIKPMQFLQLGGRISSPLVKLNCLLCLMLVLVSGRRNYSGKAIVWGAQRWDWLLGK